VCNRSHEFDSEAQMKLVCKEILAYGCRDAWCATDMKLGKVFVYCSE
jgi:hypothetical protein